MRYPIMNHPMGEPTEELSYYHPDAVAVWITENDLTDDDFVEVQWRLTPYVAYLLELDLNDARESGEAFYMAGLMAQGMLVQAQAAKTRRHG